MVTHSSTKKTAINTWNGGPTRWQDSFLRTFMPKTEETAHLAPSRGFVWPIQGCAALFSPCGNIEEPPPSHHCLSPHLHLIRQVQLFISSLWNLLILYAVIMLEPILHHTYFVVVWYVQLNLSPTTHSSKTPTKPSLRSFFCPRERYV